MNNVMKNNLPSVVLGSMSPFLLNINLSHLMEVLLVTFLGGLVGYMAKCLGEWIHKLIKEKIKNFKK